MKFRPLLFVIIVLTQAAMHMSAQDDPPKISFTGNARSQFYSDRFKNKFQNDTVTNVLAHSGNVLADLGAHIRPSKNTEIQAVIRVRNDYGGFWGSGVSFDVRQLYIKGVAADILKYQLGDINYRMTPYTLYNNDQELFALMPEVFRRQAAVVNYDKFYNNDHSWRQQGASAEFGIAFPSMIQQIQFKGVATRIKTTDFSQVNDRIFSGGTIEIVQSQKFKLAAHHAQIFDLKGTSRNNSLLSLPVSTLTIEWKNEITRWQLSLRGEAGKSMRQYIHTPEYRSRNGQFLDAQGKIKDKKIGIGFSGKWQYVSADFRSPGAQTKRINYSGPLAGLPRIGNDQHLRAISMNDLTRESDLCTTQLQTTLMPISKTLDFISPFGDATPNRMGYTAGVFYTDKKQFVDMEFSYYHGSEIRGEGTTNLRTFSRLQTRLQLNIANMLAKKDRNISITLQTRQDGAGRESSGIVPAVDMKNQTLSLGGELEVFKNWSITAGWMKVDSKGFDFTSVTDNQETVIAFEEEYYNVMQEIWAYGIKYDFSKKAFITLNYQKFNYNNLLANNNSYTLTQWTLLYQLEF